MLKRNLGRAAVRSAPGERIEAPKLNKRDRLTGGPTTSDVSKKNDFVKAEIEKSNCHKIQNDHHFTN